LGPEAREFGEITCNGGDEGQHRDGASRIAVIFFAFFSCIILKKAEYNITNPLIRGNNMAKKVEAKAAKKAPAKKPAKKAAKPAAKKK